MSTFFDDNLVKSWLAKDAALASLDEWIFWNNSPSRHVSVATLTEFFPENFFQILTQDPQIRSQVDTILRSKLSWTAPVSWRPEDPLWEVSLATPVRLQRLAFLAAALSMKEVIAKIIDGAVVRKLRQEIGEDIMEFVLLSGSLSKYAFAALTTEFPPIEDPVSGLQQRGLLFINNAFSGKEIGVQQRIASKLPGSFSGGVPQLPSPLAVKTEEMLCKVWKEAGGWL